MWRKTIYHAGLKSSRVIRGQTEGEVEFKAQLQSDAWNERWQKGQQAERKRQDSLNALLLSSQKKSLALQRTHEAQQQLDALGAILRDSIEIDHILDWETLKDRTPFSAPPPQRAAMDVIARRPEAQDLLFQPDLRFLDKLISPRRERKMREATERFRAADNRWQAEKNGIDQSNKRKQEVYQNSLKAWQEKKNQFELKQREQHATVETDRIAYLARDIRGLSEYWDHILSKSEYPDGFPKEFLFDYMAEAKLLLLDFRLPDLSSLPTLKELKYVATKDEFQEVHVSDAWVNRTYDDVLYQITLRTLYELFQSDSVGALEAIVFNGWVNSIDKATGQEVNACILSVQVTKAEFTQINLLNVDPKACFKKLKGVSGSKLASLNPVKPILQLNKEDKRFVPSYEVASALDGTSNLAAMDWMDFENLIREVFEKEFSRNGGEVKITQASRDGGVDAIAFDPDPIRGGKIVIQAKRYTNTVGVSAVRDLFGTVHNEGATKGILVTTADYGPDAYEFAKGKPLTLLSGSELLYLLQKHGHRAKIDLAEAKQLLAEQEKNRNRSK